MAAPRTPPSLDQYEEAVRFFRSRLPMTDPEFRDIELAERGKAFFVADVTDARIVQELFDALDQAVVDGTDLRTFKAKVGPQLEDAWSGEDGPRLETVFRTNVMGAYNGGRAEIMNDPVVKEARPYWRYDDVDDSRECEICAPLHGHIAPADASFWASHHPPLHHRCRCVLTPLSAEEAHAEGVPDSHPKSEPPDEGFGAPPAPGDGEPDLSGLDADIRKILRDRFQ